MRTIPTRPEAARGSTEAIGERLKVPVVSKSPAEAAKQFSFLGPFVPVDNPTSSKLTQERLGWRPVPLENLEMSEREPFILLS